MNYSPGEIAGFLREEKIALHSTSPEAYKQNALLLREIAEVGLMSDSLLGIQVIGSRANGTSDTTSDLDLALLHFPYIDFPEAADEVREVTDEYGVELDSGMAAVAIGLYDTIPDTASDLIRIVDEQPHHLASIFEDGLYASPELLVTRLAVTSILHQYETKKEAEQRWREIRDVHAEIYMGNLERMQEKLTQRLDMGRAAIESHISQDLMRERHVKFGLPSSLQAYHRELQEWALVNRAGLIDTTGGDLYEEIGGKL